MLLYSYILYTFEIIKYCIAIGFVASERHARLCVKVSSRTTFIKIFSTYI